MHRRDLHAALAWPCRPSSSVFNKKLVGLDRDGAGVDWDLPTAPATGPTQGGARPLASRQNTWGKQAEATSWVYGCDALHTPLIHGQLRAVG